MKEKNPALAGIERTEEGGLDGFNVQWLAYDDREFGGILSDWVSHTGNDTEKFSRAVGLNGSLTKDDITQLISGDKVPSHELTNFLCAAVPSDVCSWLVLRNRGYSAAGNGHTQVTIPAQALKNARLQKLKEITAPAANENSHATTQFVDWLVETIAETAENMGRTANPEKSMVNIAAALGITVDELKGRTLITGSDIPEKAEDLANLFYLEGDKFDQAVSLATSAWLGAAAGKTDMAYTQAMRFLRHTQGMNQADFAEHLGMPQHSVAGIERATALPKNNLLDKLSELLNLTDEEQTLLRGISKQYNEALKVEVRIKLEPVADHFATEGLTIDDMMQAVTKLPVLFTLRPETLIKNITGVANHFKDDGLSLKDYLSAALKQPQLFAQNPETLIKNITGVVDHFKGDGLSLKDYLSAALKQPTLFYQKPETLIGNITGVVDRFKGDGLSLKNYLSAALKQPQLFYQKPETLIGNITAVVDHFKNDGLTLADYLGAALKRPQLFYQKPETLIGNITAVVDHFKNDGLSLKNCLSAALKQPQLFSQNPETLIGNITAVVDHFKNDGLSLKNYLSAALKQPTLFTQKPETLTKNITGVANHFKNDGLSLKNYLSAALKQPTLFYQKPETLIGHINSVIEMYQKGWIAFHGSSKRRKDATQTHHDTSNLKPVFDFLVNNPALMCLADGNYTLRAIYSAVTHPPPLFQRFNEAKSTSAKRAHGLFRPSG